MDASFWRERWHAGQIGFHEGAPNRFLERFAHELGPAGRVFVPLCGKAVDLAYLAGLGHEVIGCELVQRAVLDFFEERGLAPERRERDGFVHHETPGLSILCGDALAVGPSVVGSIDAVWDRAALIALPEPMRRRYAEVITGLVPAGKRMLLVTLEHDAAAGPPFGVPTEEVRALYGPHFVVDELAREDVLAQSPHVAARGATRVFEVAYRLVRRT